MENDSSAVYNFMSKIGSWSVIEIGYPASSDIFKLKKIQTQNIEKDFKVGKIHQRPVGSKI